MKIPPISIAVQEQVLRAAFRLSFSIYKASSAYNALRNGSSPVLRRIPYGKIIALALASNLLASALAFEVLDPWCGLLILVAPYLTFALFNLIVAWLVLNVSSKARLSVANRYIKHCLRYQTKPDIPFIVYLRPFAVDSSPRLHRHRIDWDRSISGIGYTDDGRPLLASDHDDPVDYAKLLTDRMGVLIQAGNKESIRRHNISIRLLDDKWQKQIHRLCETSQLILFLPLFGVDLRTNIEFRDPIPPAISAILEKRDHDGLQIEMSLLDDPNLVAKTIFVVPGLLSNQEKEEVRNKLSSHGFVFGQESPYISEYHVRLYRCRTKGEVMRGVEIGHYLRVSLYQDALDGELGPGEFFPVSMKLGDSWITADGKSLEYWLNETATNEYLLEGNAIEYLLEDDQGKRDKKWPRGRLYSRG